MDFVFKMMDLNGNIKVFSLGEVKKEGSSEAPSSAGAAAAAALPAVLPAPVVSQNDEFCI